MTSEEFQALESVSVGLSLIVAAISLAVGVWERLRTQRRDEIRGWQQIIVQKLLQTEPDCDIALDDILRRYRSEAAAFTGHAIKPDELTADTLRGVMITLINQGIVAQLGHDKYCLWGPTARNRESARAMGGPETFQGMLGMVGPMAANMAEKFAEEKVRRAVYNAVGDEPFRHSVPELANKIAKLLNVPFDDATFKVRELIADKKLILNATQLVGLAPIGNESER